MYLFVAALFVTATPSVVTAQAITCQDAAGRFISCDSSSVTVCQDATGREVSCGGGAGADGGGGGGAGSISIENPLAADSITDFFLLLIRILLIFAIPIIVFFIIYAGFLMVTAQGNQEQITTAKRAFVYALIGGLLILGAELILTVIQGTVNSFTV